MIAETFFEPLINACLVERDGLIRKSSEPSFAERDLWHYTSRDNAWSILTENAVPGRGYSWRLSRHDRMNDPAEKSFGLHLIKNVANDLKCFRNEYGKLPCGFAYYDFNGINERGHILSGTSVGDDPVSWRLYGDDGNGVSIQLIGNYSNHPADSLYYFPVTYGSEARKLVERVLIRVSEGTNYFGSDSMFHSSPCLQRLLSVLALSVKDEFFAYEREVRLIVFPAHEDESFAIHRGNPGSTYSLLNGPFYDLMMAHVTLGPRASDLDVDLWNEGLRSVFNIGVDPLIVRLSRYKGMYMP